MKVYILITLILIILIIAVDIYGGVRINRKFNEIYYDCKDKPTLYGIEVEDDSLLIGASLSGRIDERKYYKEKEKNYMHIDNSCHEVAKDETGISKFWLKIGDVFRK